MFSDSCAPTNLTAPVVDSTHAQLEYTIQALNTSWFFQGNGFYTTPMYWAHRLQHREAQGEVMVVVGVQEGFACH